VYNGILLFLVVAFGVKRAVGGLTTFRSATLLMIVGEYSTNAKITDYGEKQGRHGSRP